MNLTIDAITFSASSGITPPVFPMHVPDASGLMPLVLPDALARRLASSESDTLATIPQTHPDPESVLRFQKIMATPIAGIPRSAIEMPDSTAVKDQPQPPQQAERPPVLSSPIPHAKPVAPAESIVKAEPSEKAEPSVNSVHYAAKILPESSIGTIRQVEAPVKAANPTPVVGGPAAAAGSATVTEVVTEVPAKPTVAAMVPATPDSPAPIVAEAPARPNTPAPAAERPAAPASPAPVAATVAEAPAKPDSPAPIVAEAPARPNTPAPAAEMPAAPANPTPFAEKTARLQVAGQDEEEPAQPLQAADLSAVRIAAVPHAVDAPAAMSTVVAIDPSAATARTNELVEAAVAVAETISATPSLVRGDGEVVIRLKPTVLDGSEIRLEAKGSSVSISVLPSNEAVAQAVARSQAQFAQQLSERMPSFQFAVTVAAVAAGSRKDKANEPA